MQAKRQEPTKVNGHQPLFGEVITGAPNRNTPGFGIPRQKDRRGSDGSMNHPSAMFPHSRSLSSDEVSPTKVNGFHGLRVGDFEQVDALKAHQRSMSEMNYQKDTHFPGNFSSLRNVLPSSHLQTLDERKAHQQSTTNPLNLLGVDQSGSPARNGFADRRPVTPPASLSYRGRGISPGRHSNNDQRLRAIIKAPAPQKSPPLRSSRPRQQVSVTGVGPAQPNQEEGQSRGLSLGMDASVNREKDRQARPQESHGCNNMQVEKSQPQLSSAVYQKPTPQLKINIAEVQHDDNNSATGATTDFEDESPLSAIPGSFPQEDVPNISSIKGGAPDKTPPSSSGMDEKSLVESQLTRDPGRDKEHSLQREMDGAHRSRLTLNNSKLNLGEEDEAGTIQIMLGEATLLERAIQDPAALGQSIEQSAPSQKLEDQALTRVLSDASSVEPLWAPVARDSNRLTSDTDHYSAYLRLLDEYREKGSFSPDMKREYAQCLLSADPTASPEKIEEAWEQAMSKVPRALDPSDIPRSDSFLSAMSKVDQESVSPNSKDDVSSGDAKSARVAQWSPDSPKVFATMRGSRISDLNDYFGQYRVEGSATPTGGDTGHDEKPDPPPKDEPLQPEDQSRSQNRSSAHTFRSVNSDHPSLPEIQDTGGGLDFPLPGPAGDQSVSKKGNHSSATESMAGSVDSKLPPDLQGSRHQSHGTSPSSTPQSTSFKSNDSPSPKISRDENNIKTKSTSQTKNERRLNQRRNLIKEMIDTEYTYHQDMTIVEDIYLATAPSVGDAMTADDIRVLFGNMRQIVLFSRILADSLKEATRSVYVRPRNLRWQRTRDGKGLNAQDRLSTSDSGQIDQLREGSDDERDRRTKIGGVFLDKIQDMEKVYGEYLRNHDHANQRLHKIGKNEKVKLWLNECHQYAKDITSAWDLDSLLVKPTQRVLKYPLLLDSLMQYTPADHPDHIALRAAHLEIRNVSSRINEAKKRTELLEQIVNSRGRGKEVELGKGFSIAFGRRKEKLRQQVGVSEAVLDDEYRAIAQKFNGHLVQIEVVMKDYEKYKDEATRFIQRYGSLVEAIEEFVDVHSSSHPEIVSKWRRFAMTIRELTAIAFADHVSWLSQKVVASGLINKCQLADMQKLCIDPLIKLFALHARPQELMRDHKQRIVEFAKFKNLKDRNEQPDKKTSEQGEQFSVLNDTLKDELPKLFALNGRVNEECLKNYVFLVSQWQSTWQSKLSLTLDDLQSSGHDDGNPPHLANIVRAFKRDYEYYERDLLSIGICNGSLLAGASNFLSSSSKSSTTLVDSPWDSQRPSTSSRRGTSASSQTSSAHAMKEQFARHSGSSVTLSPHHTNPRPSTESGAQSTQLSNGRTPHQRLRGGSGGGLPRPPPPPPRLPSTTEGNGTFYLGHSPVPTPPLSTQNAQGYETAGRHSDPQPQKRPISSSTFYTAQANPSTNPSNPQYTASPLAETPSVFSSALPMDALARAHGNSSKDRPPSNVDEDYQILCVVVSLYEFNIDKSRKEAGYPYLTYVPGEVSISLSASIISTNSSSTTQSLTDFG